MTMKILVVDDEELARQRIKSLLQNNEEYRVCAEAENGAEALMMVEGHQPDLILLDISMPVMDGLEVAKHLSDLPNPPAVIFTTAYGEYVLDENEVTGAGRKHICARMRGNLELIPIEDVYYFQADQKYVTVRHRQGEVIIEESLKSLETDLSDKFIRIHRNALVSKNRITGLAKNNIGRVQVKIEKIDDQLEVSRRHVAEIRRFVRNR